MNKENEFKSPAEEDESLTPDQRARISLRFRTAKALLARKRPRMNPNTVNVHNPTFVSKLERAPLKDLQMNINLSGSRASHLSHGNYAIGSPVSCNSISSICNSSITTESNNYSKDNTFSTPISTKLQQCEFSGRGGCSMISSLLDDDFDQSILEQIDSLCEGSLLKKLENEVDASENSAEKSRSHLGISSKDDTPKSKSNWENCDTITSSPSEFVSSQVEGNVCLSQNQDVEQAEELLSMPESYSNYIKSLNKDQLEAASTDASIPLIVVAGPGSGKTSTMVGRVLMLLNQGFAASHILAMTFTTAAASEMRDRVAKVAGKEIAKELTISTFHSFSLQLCRLHSDKLGRSSEFLIYGHGQQRRAVIEAVRLLESEKGNQGPNASERNGSFDDVKLHGLKDKSQKWQKFVTQAKASGKTPEECRQKGDEVGATVLKNYNDILKSCDALDYHDLISCSVKLLTDYLEVFEECQSSWKAIIVDEFQDTSTMQYGLMKLLASHGRITIVGDDDQSIFSFNGANISGFDSFRRDFPSHKQVRLKQNYRSTRSIVEAAASLIKHNIKRCQLTQVITDNVCGAKITLKECRNEDAQCSFVVDKIFETVSSSETKRSFGNVAILYRRQVTGKIFQAAFRDRKIPFNVHGVAFYRKKVIKAIMAMLKTALPGCDDGSFRQVFKTLLPCEKEDKKRVIEHIDKISTVRKCSFISVASDIFTAKVSGTFNRSQLSQGRKVLLTLEMISKLVKKEESLSSVITSVGNLLPQKYLLEKQAIIDNDGGKLLNEDNDLRSVLQYLLDDVTDFLSLQPVPKQTESGDMMEKRTCVTVLKAFVDYITEREKENFRCRRHNNDDSVTLTTIHQSKGLEWDTVFIVKANESEIPLLHEHNGSIKEGQSSIEEERRLLYVAMTRARVKLFILYVIMDSNWQVLRPSRFLQEIPGHLFEVQADMNLVEIKEMPPKFQSEVSKLGEAILGDPSLNKKTDEASEDRRDVEAWDGNVFLKRFNVDDRGIIARIFHQWAKKKAFQDPKRLLDKVRFVIDDRLSCKKSKNKDILVALKSALKCDEALSFAGKVIRWEQIPIDDRTQLSREKQEHFQKLRVETAMSSSGPSSKQINYLHKLGCTVVPDSKLHASRLIEQYKSL